MTRFMVLKWHNALLPLLIFCLTWQTIEAQTNCNNCGNNCVGCSLQFPDPPPIILQPPAPPPNNTCCCECDGSNNCVGSGSSCGNGCCGGDGCSNDCGGGNGANCYCPCNNCQQHAPVVNEQPNTFGGTQSRTNRCCQFAFTKCDCCCGGGGIAGGANNCGCCGSASNCGGSNCCCQPCCCNCCCNCCCGGPCCGCVPCGCLCNTFCTPCCCSPCSCYDCCHDCYPNDFDCEIGYRKRRRRRRQLFPHNSFHRLRTPYQRHFYVLPLPLPTQNDLPLRPVRHRIHYNHHHFNNHVVQNCPCACSCDGNTNTFNVDTGSTWHSNSAAGYSNVLEPVNLGNTNFGNINFNTPSSEPLPCNSNFQQPQQQFYRPLQFNTCNCNNNPNECSGYGCSNNQNRCSGCGCSTDQSRCPGSSLYNNGFLQRFFDRRRRRETPLPSFSSDKVINFLIPMFYKKPSSSVSSTYRCLPQRQAASFPYLQPVTNNFGGSFSPPHYQPYFQQPQPCNKTPGFGAREPIIVDRKCGCCACCSQQCGCQMQKKRRKRRRRRK